MDANGTGMGHEWDNMDGKKRARLIERGRNILNAGLYEILDVGDGCGILVDFNPEITETMAFPYDLDRRMVTDWNGIGMWSYDATGGKAIRELGYEPIEEERTMTMPTSDERREIASSLRHTRGIREFVDALGINLDGDWYWTDVSRRVADLIDRPTCHICETDHEFEDSVRCDRCQMTFMRPWEPFKYCPECGARVVRDDGEEI